MKLRWSREAVLALEDARAWIAGHDPGAARQTALRLLDAADRLVAFPHLGRSGRLDGTRELVVADTPFTFVYRVEADELTILAVIHHARDRS